MLGWQKQLAQTHFLTTSFSLVVFGKQSTVYLQAAPVGICTNMFKFSFFQKLLHSLSKKSSHWLPTCQPSRLHMSYNFHCPTSASKTKSKKTHCIHDLCTSDKTQQDGLQLSHTSWIAFQCPRRVAVKVGCFPENPWQKKRYACF